MPFPEDFIWGAATASYQIEGGGLDEGRGECIWHHFSHTPGKVKNGDTGMVACDHLHRYKDDVALMREIGLKGYRFSISWPRVIPAGTGEINEQGLAFYDHLVDELLAQGIEPYATLYHWDLPQQLQEKGGWENPESVQWFADYTDLMTRRLGDRLKGWITLNEPWCISILSNLIGEHAPGKKDPQAAYKVAHHLALAHGAAIRVIRQNCPGVPAGITLNLWPVYANSDSEQDLMAKQMYDSIFNRWFLDPVFKGTYPEDAVELLTPYLTGIDLDSIQAAKEPLDFIGINYYNRVVIAYDSENPLGFKSIQPEDSEYTAMNWEIYAPGLKDIIMRVYEDYAPKVIYVTENGAAYDDPEPADGTVEDPLRAKYVADHLKACEDAIDAGAPLKGYFLWSLMDNFEWAHGYSKRFGMIHVNYETQERTLKRTARMYQEMISKNGLV